MPTDPIAQARREGIAEGLEMAVMVADPPLLHRKGPIGLWRHRRLVIANKIRALNGGSDGR